MKNFLALLILFPLTLVSQQASFTITHGGKPVTTIVLSPTADSLERKAAYELQRYIKAISGALLPLNNNPSSATGIFIGSASSFYKKQASPYNWISTPLQFHLFGANSYQTLETVYTFLEEQLGCKFLAPEAEFIPKTKSLSVSGSYSYSPPVITRTVHSKLFYEHPEFAAKRRVTTEGFPHFIPEARVHTFHRFLPEKTYFSSHPEYYALVKGKRQPTQLCLSNDTVYQIILDSVAALFNRYPEYTVLSVSQDDNTQYCTCNRCAALDALEETPAASMIRLVNRIAKNFPDKTIETLAYQYTRKAPKTLKPEKNVLVTLCSIECDRSAPISQKSKDFERDLKEWGALGATLRIWDYTTQFTNFLAPFPNLETLQPNIELFVANNANWIFEQHSHNTSDLFELRCWLMSKLLWNRHQSYPELLHEFCSNYYGVAGKYIEQYVNELQAGIKKIPSYFLFLYGDPAQAFNSWLNGTSLKHYNELFDKGSTLVKNNPILLKRVEAARMGLDFATLEYQRLNKNPYPLDATVEISKRIKRFDKTTSLNKVSIMNEMGLPRTDYLNAYTKLLKEATVKNIAKGAKVVLKNKPVKYAGEDPQTLTDGAFGGWSFYANWLGFLNDMEATVDLGSVKSFNSISVSFLQVTNHVVFYPTAVDFAISSDGIHFTNIQSIDNPFPLTQKSKTNDICLFATNKQNLNGRYVKITGHNMATPPYWHHAAGTGAWIFADEIIVH